ncbi:hypothetical protein KUCAC02_037588 [Chaenocephalus aceratus]|nr:hypothetical protein KUCAC02_037588 [Chaenocephalus aceratus]
MTMGFFFVQNNGINIRIKVRSLIRFICMRNVMISPKRKKHVAPWWTHEETHQSHRKAFSLTGGQNKGLNTSATIHIGNRSFKKMRS